LQLLFFVAPAAAWAAEANEPKPSAERLLDRTPFEQVMLNQTGGGSTLDVLPLNLPPQVLASIPTTGSFKVRLLDRPTEEFELSWTNVAGVRVFEQVLLAEAERLTAAGKFDEAYDYFARLSAQSPSLAGLDDAICKYLRQNALALYQAKQPDRALALLMTLHQRKPAYPGLASAVETIAAEKIQQYLRDENYSAARRVLGLWQKQFRDVAPQSASAWQQRFEQAANRQLAEANQKFAARDFIGARRAAGRALIIWPNLPAAQQLLSRIQRDFRFITVGVFDLPPRDPHRRIDDWACLRDSPLVEKSLADEIDFGAEGGVYQSPFGEWSLDETGRELTLKLPAGSLSPSPADALARFILSVATPGNPGFRSDLAALIEGVSLESGPAIVVHLKQPHVRPEALLRIAPPAIDSGAFVIADYAVQQVVFTSHGPEQGVVSQAIVEQKLADDEAGVAALMAGDLDVLDRVPPWQVERLRAAENVHVESYKLPTVHVLIPNLKKPLLAKREFRRGLCFGIDRKWIVQRVLLGGLSVPGFDAISGPFPAGTSLNDPVRYGYNSQVQPRAFEPRLAAILSTIAWNSVQNPPAKNASAGGKSAEKSEDLVETDLPELTLAHPSDPVARLACQSIQNQLSRAGIPVKLQEFTAQELAAGKLDYDLRYAELAVWEPIADAQAILGPGGVAGGLQSPYLDAALRDLNSAVSWKEVRSRLALVHEIASQELPVIPLWQSVNFFAYRTTVHGIGDSPVTLYQNISQWSTTPPANVARDVGMVSP
jgi:tetratricopeptide (TPR) repeat protein